MYCEICSFIIYFSRFEYALTRTDDFVRKGMKVSRGDGPNTYIAIANWKSFSQAIGPEFFKEQQREEQTKILFNEPPRQWCIQKSKLEGKRVKWVKREIQPEELNSFDPVVWVRNCLVHGESQEKEVRYRELVTSATLVLKNAILLCENDPKLKHFYDVFNRSCAQ